MLVGSDVQVLAGLEGTHHGKIAVKNRDITPGATTCPKVTRESAIAITPNPGFFFFFFFSVDAPAGFLPTWLVPNSPKLCS